jgi:4-amino-4-deoxy-L-arabinose transferase-like glycosyltransferase
VSSSADRLEPLTGKARLAVAAIMALYLGLALWGAWVKSETYDEPMYVLAAYSYVTTGDLSLNREHPPLGKYLMGLPLLWLDIELPDDYHQQAGINFSFLSHQPRADTHTMLFLARLGGIVLGVLLGFYVLAWARRAFGNSAAVVALALCLLNPNVLAHCRVAANDMAPTVFIFACCYHFWRWLDTDQRSSLLWGGVTLGLALGSKLSALMLLPVLGVIVLVETIRRRSPSLMGWAIVALMASAGVLWLLYMGEARSLADARLHARFIPPYSSGIAFGLTSLEQGLEQLFGADTPIPLLSFLKGIDHQASHAATGHMTYYWGEATKTGSWAFYLVSTLIKNPVGMLLLLLLGFVAWRRTWRGFAHEAALLGFAASQYLLFSTADVQLGFKYILPVVPFLAVMASRVLSCDLGGRAGLASLKEGRWAACLVIAVGCAGYFLFDEPGDQRWATALPIVGALVCAALILLRRGENRRPLFGAAAGFLVLWSSADVLARQPHNLMYFNQWAGGPELGPYYSIVGDDWGQDTAGLGRWMAENDVDELVYDYYGTADPEVWGVHSRSSFATGGFTPMTGLVAVHAVLLYRQPLAYTWLEGKEPIAKIGWSIFIFDLTEDDVEAWIESRQVAGKPVRTR